ncbi:mucin-19-like [Dermacentor albipictus]|uniref:mucin-19-like n=1 Tax=Dermacentor albipictus TaxID=60249 RepID=UPI0038FC96BC
MITLRTTKRKKVVSTQGNDDDVPHSTAAVDDTTGFESREGPRKRYKAKRKRTLSTRWKTSPTDDLAIESTGTERYERKRYVPRRKRTTTSAGTMGDINFETSSSDETASTLKRRPSTHQGAGDDVTTHDELTVSETADLSPETASGKARASGSGGRFRKTAATTSEHAGTVIVGGETTSSPKAKNGGPADLTGHDTNAADILVDKMIKGLGKEKIVSNVGTTTVPPGGTKSEAKEDYTEVTANAQSIGSGQRKWTPKVVGITVQGRKIHGASKRENSTPVVTGRTVQGRRILTVTKGQASTPVVTGRTIHGHKILGASKRQNSTSANAGPTVKGHRILGARKNTSGGARRRQNSQSSSH